MLASKRARQMAIGGKTRWLKTILTKPPSSRCENCRGFNYTRGSGPRERNRAEEELAASFETPIL